MKRDAPKRYLPGPWWYAVAGLMAAQIALLARSSSNAGDGADKGLLTGLTIVTAAAAVGVLLSVSTGPLFYRKSNALNRTLRRRGEHVIATVQATNRLVQSLAAARGMHEPGNFTAGQLVFWRYSLVAADDALVVYDGDEDSQVVLRVLWRDVVDVHTAALVNDGWAPRGARYSGVVVGIAALPQDRALEFIPVGAGPGRAFPHGRGFAKHLETLLLARAGAATR